MSTRRLRRVLTFVVLPLLCCLLVLLQWQSHHWLDQLQQQQDALLLSQLLLWGWNEPQDAVDDDDDDDDNHDDNNKDGTKKDVTKPKKRNEEISVLTPHQLMLQRQVLRQQALDKKKKKNHPYQRSHRGHLHQPKQNRTRTRRRNNNNNNNNNDDDRIVYLLHIHKSAGTAMCELAQANHWNVNDRHSCNVQHDQRCCGNRDSLEAQRSFANTTHYDLVASETQMYEGMDPEHYRYVVVLRDSRDRYFSHYKHVWRSFESLPYAYRATADSHEQDEAEGGEPPLQAAGGRRPRPELVQWLKQTKQNQWAAQRKQQYQSWKALAQQGREGGTNLQPNSKHDTDRPQPRQRRRQLEEQPEEQEEERHQQQQHHQQAEEQPEEVVNSRNGSEDVDSEDQDNQDDAVQPYRKNLEETDEEKALKEKLLWARNKKKKQPKYYKGNGDPRWRGKQRQFHHRHRHIMPHPMESPHAPGKTLSLPVVGRTFQEWWMGQPDNWNTRQLCGTRCMGVPKYQLNWTDHWEYTVQRLMLFDTVLFVEDLQSSIQRFAQKVQWNVTDFDAARAYVVNNKKKRKRKWADPNRQNKNSDEDAMPVAKQLFGWLAAGFTDNNQNTKIQKDTRHHREIDAKEKEHWDPLMSALDDALYNIAQRWEAHKARTNRTSEQLTSAEVQGLTALEALPDYMQVNLLHYMDDQPLGNHRYQCLTECCAEQCTAY